MKLPIVVFLLTFSFINAQKKIEIDSIIKEILIPKKTNNFTANSDISLVLKVLDKELINYDFINHNKSIKYVVISPVKPNISYCTNNKTFIESTYYSNEKIDGTSISFSEIWKKTKGDSLKYIKKIKDLQQSSSYLANLNKLNKYVLDLTIYERSLDLKNLVFYKNIINTRINNTFRKNRKIKRELIKKLNSYLGNYFDTKEKEIVLQHLYITDIILNCNKIIYVEMDAFGEHYLFSIDKISKKIVAIKSLWVY